MATEPNVCKHCGVPYETDGRVRGIGSEGICSELCLMCFGSECRHFRAVKAKLAAVRELVSKLSEDSEVRSVLALLDNVGVS